MSKVLDKNLDAILNHVERHLKSALKQKVQELESQQLKKIGLSDKIAKLNDLADQKRKIKIEIAQLENDIDQGKGWYGDKLPKVVVDLGCNVYRPSKVEVFAYEKAVNLPEGKNFLAFREIEASVRAMYDLAISSKERREIILGLQNQNWRDLGINLPPINALESLEITRGSISLSSQHALKSANSG